MQPNTCPCGNTSLYQMHYCAPNEAWCPVCDGIVVLEDDGTTSRWTGTRLLTRSV